MSNTYYIMHFAENLIIKTLNELQEYQIRTTATEKNVKSFLSAWRWIRKAVRNGLGSTDEVVHTMTYITQRAQ